ncbi:glycosyltransferase family 8 protein [Leuconostoc mesenteroides]|uniref:glycosyltransferase family 8 protein n=1 Tax=Leuconostoc mesenteroides TaxID=1245 RepID=UPI00388AE524
MDCTSNFRCVQVYSLVQQRKNQSCQSKNKSCLISSALDKKHSELLTYEHRKLGYELHMIRVDIDVWSSAPTLKQYPAEMYFRLLCGEYLPKTLTRILYLDPDILVINPIKPLWTLDMKDHMIAAASHNGLTGVSQTINNVRFQNKNAYFNSGVMLMDLTKMREKVKLNDIISVIKRHAKRLILPDQDILNYLYSDHILSIPEEIWNYDTRDNIVHFTKSFGNIDLSWVIENTVILHFCGHPKPWEKRSLNRFAILYQHYEQLLRLNYGEYY